MPKLTIQQISTFNIDWKQNITYANKHERQRPNENKDILLNDEKPNKTITKHNRDERLGIYILKA